MAAIACKKPRLESRATVVSITCIKLDSVSHHWFAARLACLALCPFLLAAAQNSEPTTLLVHGEAAVSVEPDIAELDLGVQTQAQTSQLAADQNDVKTKELVKGLYADDVKLINVSVNPNYRYAKDGGAASVTGYTAISTVRITIRDLSQLRAVIESATQGGASSVNRLAFDLKDEQAARGKALAQAAAQARSSAEALAAALHLKTGRLIHIEEVQPVVISPARELDVSAIKEAISQHSPIAPGSMQIHASVNLVYAVYAK